MAVEKEQAISKDSPDTITLLRTDLFPGRVFFFHGTRP